MVRVCSFPGCFNREKRVRCRVRSSSQDVGLPVTFHRLPLHDPERLWLWLIALRLDLNPFLKSLRAVRVCSEHFSPEDYRPKMHGRKTELLLLKPTAVPTASLQRAEVSAREFQLVHPLARCRLNPRGYSEAFVWTNCKSCLYKPGRDLRACAVGGLAEWSHFVFFSLAVYALGADTTGALDNILNYITWITYNTLLFYDKYTMWNVNNFKNTSVVLPNVKCTNLYRTQDKGTFTVRWHITQMSASIITQVLRNKRLFNPKSPFTV